MGRFDELLKAADGMKDDRIVEEIRGGYPVYTDAVRAFESAVYTFESDNPDYELGNYWEILERNRFTDKKTFF